MTSRDDFPPSVKRVLADRVAHRCSNPDCRARTSGPQSDPAKAINVGVAAHITAAAPGGPRHDPALTAQERACVVNGIWLCQNCAKLVDNDPTAYPASALREWKHSAELETLAQVGKAVRAVAPRSRSITSEEAELLIACAQDGEIARMRVDQLGSWLRAGGRDFIDEEDPAVAAGYLDALSLLCGKGLCRHDIGMMFVLTGAGFKVARRLRHLMGSDA